MRLKQRPRWKMHLALTLLFFFASHGPTQYNTNNGSPGFRHRVGPGSTLFASALVSNPHSSANGQVVNPSSASSESSNDMLPEGISDTAFTIAGIEVAQALCTTCKKVVRIVDQVLRLNSTKQEFFQEATARLCNFLPTEEQTACNVLTRRTHPAIYQCVLHSVDSATICSDDRVALCPQADEPATDQASTSLYNCVPGSLNSDPLTCAGCEFSIGALQLYMNHSAASLVRAFQRDICITHFTTGPESAVCTEMLSLFGSLLLSTAVARIDAADVCCDVGVCGS